PAVWLQQDAGDRHRWAATVTANFLSSTMKETRRLQRFTVATVVLAAVTVFAGISRIGAQIAVTGQDISPAYEGWEKNADGSFNLVFGYFNRNWEEELDIPIGPDNNIEPGGPDRGQPTHFLPRRNRFLVRIRVPQNFDKQELVWTLTTHGKTNRA